MVHQKCNEVKYYHKKLQQKYSYSTHNKTGHVSTKRQNKGQTVKYETFRKPDKEKKVNH